jgi:hypothetical protein
MRGDGYGTADKPGRLRPDGLCGFGRGYGD